MARIFISHSSRDNDAADRMKAWLGSQGFEKAFLDKDKVTGIPPGADWEKTLYRQVELSQAVIILQTRNWLDSKWCFAEFTQARALGKPIFPVIEIPANGARIAPDIQALDLTSNRVDGLERLKLELVRIARDVGGGYDWDPRRSPFPGLHAFQEEDAAVYFGRGDEIRGLIERLEARRAQGGAKLIALLGSSGSGKSSLLRAGLVPRLKGGGHNWIVIQPIRPGERPVDALAVTLAAAQGLDGNWRKLRDELVGSEPEHALADLANDLRVKNGAPEAQILLTIDQTEELFGVTDPDENSALPGNCKSYAIGKPAVPRDDGAQVRLPRTTPVGGIVDGSIRGVFAWSNSTCSHSTDHKRTGASGGSQHRRDVCTASHP